MLELIFLVLNLREVYHINFDRWNKVKKRLNRLANKSKFYFSEREIWLMYTGINVGIEQNGSSISFLRPVLVFRKFNRNHFLGIPLTSKAKSKLVSFVLDDVPFLKSKSWLIVSQIRALDSSRLLRRLGKLSSNTFKRIQQKSARIIIRASGA